jgi:hypothetical protein
MTLSQRSRLLVLAASLLTAPAWAQPPSPAASGAPISTPRPAPARNNAAAKVEAQPTWAELQPQQQQALAPLAGTWSTLNRAHKRKWIAMSASHPTMTAAEQSLMHSRMAEWAALSPQQRTQARLNFAETKVVPSTDKKAKWEAYQALPAEEKRRLAARAAAAKPPPPPTAAAVKPVPQQKLVKVPKARKGDAAAKAAAPAKVDRNTLLPQVTQPQAQQSQAQPQPGAGSLQAP